MASIDKKIKHPVKLQFLGRQ